jgi:hypothetical protein
MTSLSTAVHCGDGMHMAGSRQLLLQELRPERQASLEQTATAIPQYCNTRYVKHEPAVCTHSQNV